MDTGLTPKMEERTIAFIKALKRTPIPEDWGITIVQMFWNNEQEMNEMTEYLETHPNATDQEVLKVAIDIAQKYDPQQIEED